MSKRQNVSKQGRPKQIKKLVLIWTKTNQEQVGEGEIEALRIIFKTMMQNLTEAEHYLQLTSLHLQKRESKLHSY